MENKTLKCDMIKDCNGVITHIDNKGFIYCNHHGEQRKHSCSCRKLKPYELNRIKRGEQIKKY